MSQSTSLTAVINGLGRVVAFHPGLARMVGSVKAGILLDQLLYWWPRRSDQRGVYKTQAELTEEICLSRKEQECAKKVLVRLGILSTYYARLEHKLFFILHEDKLNQLWSQYIRSADTETDNRDRPKGETPNAPFGHSSSLEITTEITSTPPPNTQEEQTEDIENSCTVDNIEKKVTHPTVNVPMNAKRYETLCTTWGARVVDGYIQRAADYIAAVRPRKPYADYAAAAANWIAKDEREGKIVKPKPPDELPDISGLGELEQEEDFSEVWAALEGKRRKDGGR